MEETVNALISAVEIRDPYTAGHQLRVATLSREIGLAMGLFMLYWAIMLGGIAFAVRAVIPPWIGVWSANILLFILGVYLFGRVAGK